MPGSSHFAVVDLVRLLFLDPRVSTFFAEKELPTGHKTLLTLLSRAHDLPSCPYNLRIVMLQLACNLFSAPPYAEHLTSRTADNVSSALRETCLRLATGCLLDREHANLRVVAASFAFNVAAFNHNARFAGHADKLSEEDQVELAASLLEAVAQEEESVEALHGLLFALGLLVYGAPLDGAVVDLCRAMGVVNTAVNQKPKVEALRKEPLLKEVGQELLAKGLSLQ